MPLRCWCGAGKGMHSRLYTRVLNKHAWMHNCTAFNSLYNDTGIVGVFASAESAHAEEAVDVLTREMLVRACCAWPPLCLCTNDKSFHTHMWRLAMSGVC